MIEFDVDGLLDDARQATGLSDFGTDDFLEALAVAARSLDTEARLSPSGRLGQRAGIVGHLTQRLLLEEWIRRHPEILDERIEPPVVIVGLPRTGTTMLFRMLSVSPGLTAPLHFEARRPTPPLDWDFRHANDPRVAEAKAAIAAMNAAAPDLISIYPFEALAPEEDIFISAASFRTTSTQSGARVPSFEAWLAEADRLPLYRFLERNLQLLQWQRRRTTPPVEPARWLLKTPDHLHGLDALLTTWPEAKVIQTHRDPVQTIPSICNFIRTLHSLATDEVDDAGIGDAWSSMFARSAQRAMAVREDGPDRFFDVWYDDTVHAPRKVAAEVFAFLGRSLDEDAWSEMERWRDENRREARPAHEYSLEQFGLSPERIEREFADYRQRYILPRQV
jgi:Sulfotransferase family